MCISHMFVAKRTQFETVKCVRFSSLGGKNSLLSHVHHFAGEHFTESLIFHNDNQMLLPLMNILSAIGKGANVK